MYYKIENEFLTCEIDDMGAQLHSLVSKENGKEYIWYGKTEIWYGQAPVLFPVIGQLINDKYFYNGKEYSMPKHGLARKLLFNVKETDDVNEKIIQALRRLSGSVCAIGAPYLLIDTKEGKYKLVGGNDNGSC
jgi:galactose mutarotase-like enzyme